MNTISIEHLGRDYGEGKGIFDISFHVKQGEVFGFLGPNGAGKTILMSSHIFEEVERTCDRIGIIRKGKMVARGFCFRAAGATYLHLYCNTGKRSRSPGLCRDFSGMQNGRQVTVKPRQSLEEIFMNYYGDEKNDESDLI